MFDKDKFEELLKKSESRLLDFKATQYYFTGKPLGYFLSEALGYR